VRLALGFNIINMLPDLLINTTLIWEPAALFYDLLIAVFKSLVPLVVFIIYIGFTFVFLFYTLGSHQIQFDYFTDPNLDAMKSSMLREYDTGDEAGEAR
jgi:hypothetical protein